MAIAFDLLLLLAQRLADPVAAGPSEERRLDASSLHLAFLGTFGDAFDFIFHQQDSSVTGRRRWSADLDQVLDLTGQHLEGDLPGARRGDR